ncbi:unnamed protein product, partial [Adineta steineri]
MVRYLIQLGANVDMETN